MADPAIKKLYYSIGEVAQLTDLKPYVLRYWETEFHILNPTKNRAGNRIYKDRDIKIIFHIKYLLYDQKYTIEGAKEQLKSFNPEEVSDESIHDSQTPYNGSGNSGNSEKYEKVLGDVKKGLKEILSILED